jgi:hypothetical protein
VSAAKLRVVIALLIAFGSPYHSRPNGSASLKQINAAMIFAGPTS